MYNNHHLNICICFYNLWYIQLSHATSPLLTINSTSFDRKHFRDVLKQQMADQDLHKSVAFKEKCQESQQSIAYDNDCRQKDLDAYIQKHTYLQNFRDGNKNVGISFPISILPFPSYVYLCKSNFGEMCQNYIFSNFY